MGWEDAPTSIDEMSMESGFIFAVDENGTAKLDKNYSVFDEEDINKKWFTLTGVLIDLKDFNSLRDSIMELKLKYWTDGKYNGERVVFHSKDIRKKQGPFNPKIINYNEFLIELNELLQQQKYKIYSINVDKYSHDAHYINPYPVYELSVEYIMERLCYELNRLNKKGVILFESRGQKEDNSVLGKINTVLKKGNDYHRPFVFRKIDGVYFNRKSTPDKQKSYWILELADILSYRIHRFVKTSEKDQLFKSIETKFSEYPDHDGKGLKICK